MMRLIGKFMYATHRILGTVLCLVFLMWFLSAFVMMYHRFPRVGASQIRERSELLSATDAGQWLPVDSALSRLPNDFRVSGLTLSRYLGQTKFTASSGRKQVEVPVSPEETLLSGDERLQRILQVWGQGQSVERIDTLTELDQFVPFGSMKKQLPIYRYHFSGPEEYQLYIGSTTGDILQFTDKDQRFWAWLGAIPHWIYFTWLRQNQTAWTQTVIWSSGIGCLMVIAGMWVGIDVWRKSRRASKRSGIDIKPYRKRWYRLHYTFGLVFGIICLTFAFSGMMSMMDTPQWIHHTTMTVSPTRVLQSAKPSPKEYLLDYRKVLAAYPEAKEMTWNNFRNHPYYTVTGEDFLAYVDATDTVVKPLSLTREEIEEGVRQVYLADSVFGGNVPDMEIESIDHYETYYRNMSNMLHGAEQLPVWKISVSDPDNSTFYVQPKTGTMRYVSTSSRWHYWMYTALHRMRIGVLNENAFMRKTVLWVLLIGGTVVSATGVVLGVNYVRRKCRKRSI